MESINDIIPKEYKSRPFLTGTTKVKAPRSIDRYSDDPNEGRGNGVPIETEVERIAPADAFVQAVWADMNQRLGVTPNEFERILKDASLSPVRIDIANKGKILQLINILLTPGAKGIWIEGDTGRGKTFVLEFIINVNNKYVALGCTNVRKIITKPYYDMIVEMESANRLHEIIDRSIKGSTFVDDVLYSGIKHATIYNKDKEVIGNILERIHHQYMREHKMFATANFSFEDIKKMGVISTTISRMKAMFHVFRWEGTQDFREL